MYLKHKTTSRFDRITSDGAVSLVPEPPYLDRIAFDVLLHGVHCQLAGRGRRTVPYGYDRRLSNRPSAEKGLSIVYLSFQKGRIGKVIKNR